MNVSWQLETEENSCSCKFPFQSEGYFYYGCNQENKCAASIDNSFKPSGDLIDCEEKCHKQSEYILNFNLEIQASMGKSYFSLSLWVSV